MKALLVNGSPRPKGTTAEALKHVAGELEAAGVQVEVAEVGRAVQKSCMACNYCKKPETRRCVFGDDMVNACIDKAESTDGFVFATPVYYGGIAGGMKCFMDRFFHAGGYTLDHKAAASFVCLRRSGGVDAYHGLNNYLHLSQAVLAPTPYWGVVHGAEPEDLAQDEEGVRWLRMLGRNVAWLMRTLSESKVPAPEALPPARTNFVRR